MFLSSYLNNPSVNDKAFLMYQHRFSCHMVHTPEETKNTKELIQNAQHQLSSDTATMSTAIHNVLSNILHVPSLLSSSSDTSSLDDKVCSLLSIASVSQVRSSDSISLWVLTDFVSRSANLEEV